MNDEAILSTKSTLSLPSADPCHLEPGMPLEDINIDEITETDLQALIDAGVPEGRDVDYKEQTYGNSDSEKKEFVADVSSFTNTNGGHILIGIQEEGGVACAMPGIEGNPDRERTRLEQIARHGLQPRLSGLRVVAVPITGGRHILVVRIPHSWNPPHRVITQGSNKFYARDGGGKYEPDVDQLRDLFMVAPKIAEQVRDFRVERIVRIAGADTFVRLADPSALILHILPFEGFAGGRRFSIGDLYPLLASFAPIAASSYTGRVNLEGMLTITGAANPEPKTAYTEVWRSGLVEAVRSPIVRERDDLRVVFSGTVEPRVVDTIPRYLSGLRALGVNPPLAILITLLGVRGAKLDLRRDIPIEEVDQFNQDIVHTSEIILDEWPRDDREVPFILRPAFDEIANAAGRFGSLSYGSDGSWRRP